jgi:hypothetical protein
MSRAIVPFKGNFKKAMPLLPEVAECFKIASASLAGSS